MNPLLMASLGLLLLMLCAACLAALPVDEKPAGPGEWDYRPFDGKLSAVDPPGFVWRPQKDAATYELQVARDPGFADRVYDVKGLTLYCNCPPKSFGPGSYFWRFRFVTAAGDASNWSSTRRFTLDATSKAFPCPTREDILSRIPATHPRLFVRPEDVARFKELAAGRLKPQWDGIIASCEKILKAPPDITEPPTYPPDVKRGENDDAWRQIWWGNRTRVEATCGSAATLAFAYMLGGDERYAAEARRLILAACAWDPKGATGYRYNDEAGMPFSYLTTRTYTWLYGYLSEDDRAKIRACMRIRGEEMYNHLMGKNHIWAPYDSHANRAWHKLGEVGTAFYGEIPGAEDWVWFAMNKFWCAYPVWNDDFGGWHEGISYWTGYLTKVTWWLATLKATYGIDGFQKPFFSRVGNFPLYVVPPGETVGGYGDLSTGFTARNCSSTTSIFARMAQNPYWEWLVENSGGSELPGGYMGFIYGTTEKVASKPPSDLPSSMLFPGIGVAVLHNDLVERANDVNFMLKASPMGSQSHGYDAQNSFLLSVAGDPVFIASGKRDLYGSPHHSNWMWETKSTNSILVDGKGQDKHSNRPQGEITRFATSAAFDYVVGEAAAAYSGRLKRFTRAVLFIKPGTLVMFDTLQAPQPATFQWLLHSNKPMDVEGQTIVGHGAKNGAVCQLVAPGNLKVSQTDQFDTPPQSWVKLTQYHVTAATQTPQSDAHFISVLRTFKDGEQLPTLAAREVPVQGGLACEFDLPGGKAIVLWREAAGTAITAGGLTTDAEVACVLLDTAGKVTGGFCQGGSVLTYQGAAVTASEG
jgi:hypothetical protein